MEEHIQKTIATQLETSIPAIVETKVKYLMSNKFLDKTISTTIGTKVSKITRDESIKAINKKTAGNKNTPKEVTQTPEQDHQQKRVIKQCQKIYYYKGGSQQEQECAWKKKKKTKSKKR
eukprot:14329402-Ditylum_brightwellii.AAC.1